MLNGAEVALASLVEEGVQYIFGLPGTSEIPLVAAINEAPVKYFLCQHETVAVGMADGFSRAAGGSLAIACTHATQGTLNAAGYLRIGLRDQVPTLLLAGTAGTGYALHEPNHHLTNMSSVLTAITKWTWHAQSSHQIPHMIHRGITIANTGTPGPVAMFIPQDLLEAESDGSIYTRVWSKIANDGYPGFATVQRLRSLIDKSERPVVLAGGSVSAIGAMEALANFSDRCSVPVIGESVDRGPMVQPLVLPPGHPNFVGYFSQRDPEIAETLRASDLIIAIGVKTDYRRVMGDWIEGANVVQIDPSAWEIGKNHDLVLGIVGHPESVLRAVIDDWRPEAKNPITEYVQQSANEQSPEADPAKRSLLLPDDAADVIAESFTRNDVLVDDSQSFGGYLKTRLRSTGLRRVFGSLSSHLGWGLPAALGIQLALPGQRAVAVVSDGSLMGSFQALWTAARYRIPIVVVVINNGGSVSLKQEMGIRGELCLDTNYADLRLNGRSPDYVGIARCLGIDAMTVESRSELLEGLGRSHAQDAPFLLDLRMSGDESDWAKGWYVPPTSTL